MKEKNIAVLPPDINKSKAIFWVEGNGIRFGLGALRGVGQDAIEKVIIERQENGEFKDFADFVVRCAKYVNKRIVESLIYAGAFDCFGQNRAQVSAVYEEVFARVNAMDKQKAGAQISLFGEIIEEQALEVSFPNIPEFETMEKLSKEKSVLGVYVSGHPFEKFLPYFKDKTFNCSKLNAYEEDEEGVKTYTEIADGVQVSMGGMIGAFKKLKTRSGAFMAFITVEDLYGSIECVCFPKIYEKVRGFLETDRVVSLTGKMSIETDKAPVIILDKMEEFIEEQPKTPTAEMKTPVVKEKTDADKTLWLNVSGMEEADIDELKETLTYYEGETKVFFVQNGKKFLCSQKVTPNRALFAELAGFLPDSAIKLL